MSTEAQIYALSTRNLSIYASGACACFGIIISSREVPPLAWNRRPQTHRSTYVKNPLQISPQLCKTNPIP
jgi:hypothetical protein